MSSVDPFSLEGKRVLVTGASSGIGRQIAIACSQMGASVVITGRHSERLDETARALQGDGHLSIVADLTQDVDTDRLVAQAANLNGVVHAAGVARLAPFRMISRAQLNEQFSANTFAPILLTKGLLAKKRIEPNGSIVFISAIASHMGPAATGVYSATKGALLGAMRSLGLEVAKQGLRANCIAPNYVRTPMLDGLSQGGGGFDDGLNQTPLGIGEPEDVAYAAVFFLSDASRWITRNYFIIDGGLTTAADIYA